MLDRLTRRPAGAPEGYENWKAAFAVITVEPRTDAGRKPLMPFLSRGQLIEDERGDLWTVMWGRVMEDVDESSGDELPYRYVYVYNVVNGRRVLD